MTIVSCSWCGYEFPKGEEITIQDPPKREPCPDCGSTSLIIKINMHSEVTLRGMMGIKFKTPGEKKPAAEFKEGQSLHAETGKWNKLKQEINRRENRYYKKIIDGETGETIREVDEPLTDHRGYGSAKHQKNPKRDT